MVNVFFQTSARKSIIDFKFQLINFESGNETFIILVVFLAGLVKIVINAKNWMVANMVAVEINLILANVIWAGQVSYVINQFASKNTLFP